MDRRRSGGADRVDRRVHLALEEVARILKPGGEIRIFDYALSRLLGPQGLHMGTTESLMDGYEFRGPRMAAQFRESRNG